jgi:ATP-dependent Clp protease ATP-binding subunit ClpB
MTSNIGSHMILENAQTDWAAVETMVLEALRQHFRPEFLNRVDDVVVFHPLRSEHIDRIIDLQLTRLERLLADRKLTIEVTPPAKRILTTEGYDPAFGARPLKRAIQRLVQNPLALSVLEGRFKDGDHIVVEAEPGGELSFRKAGNEVEVG